MAEVLRMYSQRRRAKDATLSLLRLNETGNISVRAYVFGWQKYYLRVSYPDWIDDAEIKGALSLGVTADGAEISADDCTEFYQGEGMSRFRGV